MQFIDLKTQTKRIESQIYNRIKKVIDEASFIMGKEVGELEEALAAFVGAKHAISVSSGTDALLIALMALGVRADDEIITTPFSFFATAEVIALLGAKPVFVDIDKDTYNIDPSKIEAAITPRTKAIMPVSLYGQCADFDAINEIANRYKLPVIEDAAQSFGATYKNKKSCALTTIGCTSFFPSKPLGCFGDGGACFTNDDALAKLMKEIRIHGQSRRYYHTSLGINGRLDTLQAGILLEKLKIFPEEIELRQEVAARYQQLLPASIRKPITLPYNLNVFAQYTIEVDDRESVQKSLLAEGIPTAVHYPVGLHEQPIFEKLYGKTGSYPRAEGATKRVLSLPMHPYLTMKEQQKVSDAVAKILEVASA